MTLKLYGSTNSRALRSIWCLEETGVDYELVKTSFFGDTKTPEYLALNPNGRVPTLRDGDFVLWESMAINLYLARKYGGPLWPASENDQALALQWSFWGMTEIEPNLIAILIHRTMLPEDQRNPRAADDGERDLARPLKVLDAHVAERPYLLGDAFTIADLNAAGALALSAMVGFDLAPYPNAAAWLSRCSERPAMAKARAAGA